MGKSAILSVRILSDADQATKGMAEVDKSLDKMSKNAEKASDGMKLAGLAAGAAMTKGLIDAIDADGATRKMAGQLGLGAEEAAKAGEISGSLYRDAYGSSIEEVNTAVTAVGSTLADVSANGGADVERLSAKAMDLASTFGVEVSEAVSTAGALVKNGLAADGDEAMDLLVGSLQKMPQAMQAELFPIMDEYSKHFADLGIDGTTALGMVVNASQDGAIGMDKVGDSLKELTIRATDGSATTIAAYEAIGLSNEDMAAKMLAGGDQANDAFGQIVHGLQEVEDPAAQAAAAVALFGTPLEDLGTAGIPDFLGAIDPAGDAFDSLAGSADSLSETINTGPGPALESMKREMLGSLQDTAAGALPLIEPLIGLFKQFAPVLGPLAVAIAVAAAAQWVLNAAMYANPIGLIIGAVVLLVAGLIMAYQNVGWFKDAVNLVGAVAGAVFGTIIGWISTAVSWLVNVIGQSQTFQAAIDLIGAVFSLMGTLAQAAWDLVIAGITVAVDWFLSITRESETFQNIMGGLGEIGAAVFGTIDDAISKTIGWVKDAIGWFQGLFGAKNDAAAADAGGGAGSRMADPVSLAAPSLQRMAEADPLALAYGAVGAASYSSPTSYAGSSVGVSAVDISSGLGRLGRAAQPARAVNVKVEFKGLVTDKIGVAREIRKILDDAAELVGADN